MKIILDTECYINYFLVSFLDETGKKLVNFEKFNDSEFPSNRVKAVMSKRTTVGFNSINYDLAMLTAACAGWSNAELKKLSDALITSGDPAWLVCRKNEIEIPASWDHIDLIEVAPGQASLKIYAGRIDAPKMQDLPISPSKTISEQDRQELLTYCRNDVDNTLLLMRSLEKQIALREKMSSQYKIDLRSKSDAQIAEAVIKLELTKKTKKRYSRPSIKPGTVFKYKLPDFIRFETAELKAVLELVLNSDFVVGDNGQIEMPESLAGLSIDFFGGVYRMGIGGLHSSEKCAVHESTPDIVLEEQDVASYYPNIILGQNLYPQHLGLPFLDVYGGIVRTRLAAKAAGDKVTADTLKITINGSFGKLGSKWSLLYAPDLMIQTTITGQLALLMLIERMELAGIKVVSANTDGIVLKYSRHRINEVRSIEMGWELDAGFTLEENEYKAIYSRDVNNYIAVKANGSYKGKGAYADAGLMKNPANRICVKAVVALLTDGVPVDSTIKACRDITQFATIRQVKGGAEKDGRYLGKAVRWYYSRKTDTPILYTSNGNKVARSDGAMPLMDLPDTFPSDIDYDWYIAEAESILKDIGYAGI